MAGPDIALAGGSRERFDVWMTGPCSIDRIKRRRYRLWRPLQPFARAAGQHTHSTDEGYGQRGVFNLGRAEVAPLQALGELSPNL
jgi:hypothetical protein